MEINITLLFFVSVLIIIFILGCFVNMLDDNKDNKESFVDDYYYWNWNDPMMLTTINSIKPHCKNCKYSMSCDFTDDALPFCYKSFDYPTKLKNGYEGHYY